MSRKRSLVYGIGVNDWVGNISVDGKLIMEVGNASNHCYFSNDPHHGDYVDWGYGHLQNEWR